MPIVAGCRRAIDGYALVEILLSALIGCGVLGVLLQLAVVAQRAARTQADVADLQQRLRVAAHMIHNDLSMAGAGPSDSDRGGGLISILPPIVPARTGIRGADAELTVFSDRISILYVPDESSQTVTTMAMAGPLAPLAVAGAATGCPPGGSCGFAPGDRALVFDPADPSAAYDIFTVSDASGAVLSPASPLSTAYGAGSVVMKVVQRVYYLDRPTGRLMIYDGDSSDLPLVDHVVDLRFTYYADPAADFVPRIGRTSGCVYSSTIPPVSLLQDLGGTALKALTAGNLTDGPVCGSWPHRFDGDLLRIRRIRVTLRLETEATDLRSQRAVPDQQITFDVTPSNLNLFR